MKDLTVLSFVLTLIFISGCASSSQIDWSSPKAGSLLVSSQRAVMLRTVPILLVIHIAGEDQWMFLSGQEPPSDPSVTVPLDQVLKLDPSVMELSDLPVNWKASRSSDKVPWIRSPL